MSKITVESSELQPWMWSMCILKLVCPTQWDTSSNDTFKSYRNRIEKYGVRPNVQSQFCRVNQVRRYILCTHIRQIAVSADQTI